MEYSVCTWRWTNESEPFGRELELEAAEEDIGSILSLATDGPSACREPCRGGFPTSHPAGRRYAARPAQDAPSEGVGAGFGTSSVRSFWVPSGRRASYQRR